MLMAHGNEVGSRSFQVLKILHTKWAYGTMLSVWINVLSQVF